MTPKEKAKELYNKFYTFNNTPTKVNNVFAKQCALIAVDEILKYSPNLPVDEIDPIGYFKEVKQEIEKL